MFCGCALFRSIFSVTLRLARSHSSPMTALILNLHPAIELTDEQFFQLCQNNRDLRLERTAEGELIIMPPTGWKSGNQNSRLTQRLGNWTEADGTGLAFDSSTGFKLPNGANRSPDASWVTNERLVDVFNILYISHIVLISYKLNIALFAYIFRCFMVCSSGFRFL